MKINQLPQSLERDFKILLNHSDLSKEIFHYRAVTVAINVIGATSFFFSFAQLAIHAGSFALTPGCAPLLSGFVAILIMTLSRDLMQVGINRSEILKCFDSPKTFKKYFTQATHIFKTASQMIQVGCNPAFLEMRNTWILLPLYKTFTPR